MTKSGHTRAPKVDWDAARCHLLVDYGATAHPPRHEEVAVPAIVVLDRHGSAIDVDIMALPDRVAGALATYAVSVRKPPRNGIAFDVDAAWLWLHLVEGIPARQFGGTAHVRIAFDGTEIAEVELTLHSITASTPGDSR
ncbi:hypothetical protein [Streptomyces sp. NPDC058632]|uniref:hypothetical protein n=1 Tax=unclassified Streptomyces TaxID=2593676 RepID=UPI0036649BBE